MLALWCKSKRREHPPDGFLLGERDVVRVGDAAEILDEDPDLSG